MVDAFFSVEPSHDDPTRFGRSARTVPASETEDRDLEITRVIGAARRPVSANRSQKTSWTGHTTMPHEIGGYRLVREIGRGGMGIVYEARPPSARGHVALKMICPETPGAQKSLLREIGVLRRLDHPGIVRFCAASAGRDVAFCAMELVTGPRLSSVTGEFGTRKTFRRMLTLLRRVASTLAFLHRGGVVHGDLTPSNVLLRTSDEPVLIDFGLAVELPDVLRRNPSPAAARQNRRFGTLAYMAPEQIRGEPIDARADLYAFGCILYQALTGRAPFTGRHRDTVRRQHLEAPPCPPSFLAPRIPALLDDLTMRLLAKSPDDRPENAAVVAAVLGSLGAKGERRT